jgi:membrane protein YqaA with SNARE-associated domain
MSSSAATAGSGKKSGQKSGMTGALRKALSGWMAGPRAYVGAVIIGLLEAVIPFITPEVFLIPMLAAAKKRLWLLALFPVIGNLVAALVLYGMGALLAEPVVEPLVAWMGAEAEYGKAVNWLREDGFVALFLLDLVPIPVQVVLLAAGVAGYSLPLFLLAIGISRALRYLLIAGVVAIVGSQARKWLEEHQLEIFGVGLLISAALGAWMIFF